MLTPQQMVQRFEQQATWTQSIRQYVYQTIGLNQAKRVLEIGCGEGVILSDLLQTGVNEVHGLDIRLSALQFSAQNKTVHPYLSCGNALSLPFPADVFDVTLCHFTLMWLKDPLWGLKEMRRVTHSGGWVVALAEPDYGGRIDFPMELAQVGQMQAESLADQGADPNLGRKLSALLHQSGLKQVQTGVLGGQWSNTLSEENLNLEWQTLRTDLAQRLSSDKLEKLQILDMDAWIKGERVLFVPTFYGWGRVA
jgi:ubiquinone/menaquinone biosynthesis C-methylase UbiE